MKREIRITNAITQREDESIEKYLSEVSKYKLITAEEEVELANNIKSGCKASFDKLVNANLRFVISVAKKYQGQGLSLSDLINEGNTGLIRAARDFNPTFGFKFITYAVGWIRQKITAAILEHAHPIRMPANVYGIITKKYKAIEKFKLENGFIPNDEQLSEITGLSIKHLKQSGTYKISFDVPVNGKNGESDDTFSDIFLDENQISTDKNLINNSLHADILRVMNSRLNYREKDIIVKFFGIGTNAPSSLEEIADIYDLSTERVRQIKQRAVKKLQGSSKILRQYLN
jgi:RNA polymerase primary sigma factor